MITYSGDCGKSVEIMGLLRGWGVGVCKLINHTQGRGRRIQVRENIRHLFSMQHETLSLSSLVVWRRQQSNITALCTQWNSCQETAVVILLYFSLSGYYRNGAF